RALRQLTTAQAELRQAHAQLEQLVDSRTAELRQTNDALKTQIAQRLQTEGELLQASKLAVLGQMSAGLSHEVNQPL
ncbi:sensor histidine kinase, partial [Acinetobacter baumannii]